MTLIPMDSAHFAQQFQNDTQAVRTFMLWLHGRNQTYALQCSSANMTTAGIASGDQTAILAFVADCARLEAYMTGTVQAIAGNMSNDVINIIGVM